MAIEVACECGKRLRVKDEYAGKRGKCPDCGNVLKIPAAEVEADVFDLKDEPKPVVRAPLPPVPVPAAMPVQTKPTVVSYRTAKVATKAPSVAPASRGRSVRDYLYFGLLLALIPLLVSIVSGRPGEENSVKARLEHTIESHPEVQPAIDKLSDEAGLSDLINLLPNHRVEGALLARDTWVHWLFALGSGAMFFALLVLLFPGASRSAKRLLLTGVVTGTVGIVLLIAFQFLADWTQGFWVRGRSVLVLLFYIVKFIGYSYRAALDPDTSFLLSCVGFTFGVGLCEEVCKALPILVPYVRGDRWAWRVALLVGLASGVGFGVSEGITYSSDYYNGIDAGGIYLVRFVSCVALHAVWSGAGALVIHRRQALISDAESVWHMMLNVVVILIVPMVLHGLYDTLLKKDMDVLALVAAVVSFGWLAFQIEWTRKEAGEEEEEGVAGVAMA